MPENGAMRDGADRSHTHSSPLLDQPFVVGPGFLPVSAKLVSQIVSGKYVDLSELLAVNLELKELEPQLLLDGHSVIMSYPKKQKQRIKDIATWMEAFSIYSLILVSHFPHRWRDLNQYQLLILCMFRHFAGKVWLATKHSLNMPLRPVCLIGRAWNCSSSTFTLPALPCAARPFLLLASLLSLRDHPHRWSHAFRGTWGVAWPPTLHAGMPIVAACVLGLIGPWPAPVAHPGSRTRIANSVAVLQELSMCHRRPRFKLWFGGSLFCIYQYFWRVFCINMVDLFWNV